MNNRYTNRILIVEDEPAIGKLCGIVLCKEGFDVDIATNGKSAQLYAGLNTYDLCLIDIRIPVMDGIEIYLWLQRQHPEFCERVIFTTGDVLEEETSRFLEALNRPLLLKPFTPDQLKETVITAFQCLSSEVSRTTA